MPSPDVVSPALTDRLRTFLVATCFFIVSGLCVFLIFSKFFSTQYNSLPISFDEPVLPSAEPFLQQTPRPVVIGMFGTAVCFVTSEAIGYSIVDAYDAHYDDGIHPASLSSWPPPYMRVPAIWFVILTIVTALVLFWPLLLPITFALYGWIGDAVLILFIVTKEVDWHMATGLTILGAYLGTVVLALLLQKVFHLRPSNWLSGWLVGAVLGLAPYLMTVPLFLVSSAIKA